MVADNALTEGRAHTYALLDDEATDGLIRLLVQAREVRRLAADGERGSTTNGGSGTVAA